MVEPTFDETTERLYARLPEVYRTADINQNWQFKKWISGAGGVEGDLDTLLDRFTYVAPDAGPGHRTSDLVDPQTADAEWLPWLAQLVGVKLDTTQSVQFRRDQISNVSFFKGTKAAMAEVAKTVLTGDKYIAIYDHSVDSANIGLGGQWDVLIVTKATETSSSPSAAIIAAGAKPAGVQLHEETFSTTWDAVEAAFPTWDDWDAATWNQIEEAGL